jgi:hypothetical protein
VSEDLYESPRSAICQGDIFEFPPHISARAPLTFLQDVGNGEQRLVEHSIETEDREFQIVAANGKRLRAILITWDCENEKPKRNWLVCPVQPLAQLPKSDQTQVKKNKVLSTLYLPEYRDILPDSFVNFNHISTLDRNLVQHGRRTVSLSNLGRAAFYNQFIRWLTRWKLHEITCPNCNTNFDPTLSLPVRPPGE